MSKIAAAVGVLVLVIAAYLAYRYWQIQSLAKKYATASEIASASIQKNGPTWTIHIESVIADPIDAVWKALRQPERSAELVPTAFHHSTLVKEEGNKKIVELEVTLLSLPSQKMLAELAYDDAARQVKIETSKGLQDMRGRYQLTALSPAKTLLVFEGTAVEKVSLPVPQSFVEGALRELFVVQVRAVQAAIHGTGGTTTVAAAAGSEAPKLCVGPPPPDSSKLVTVTVARAATSESAPASESAEFRRDVPQGYDRGYLVEGVPVRESYRADTRCTTATATVGALMLQVQSVLLSPDNLESWVKKVDLKALASLAPSGEAQGDQQQKLLASFPTPPLGWQIVPPTTAPTLPGPLAFQVYEQGFF